MRVEGRGRALDWHTLKRATCKLVFDLAVHPEGQKSVPGRLGPEPEIFVRRASSVIMARVGRLLLTASLARVSRCAWLDCTPGMAMTTALIGCSRRRTRKSRSLFRSQRASGFGAKRAALHARSAELLCKCLAQIPTSGTAALGLSRRAKRVQPTRNQNTSLSPSWSCRGSRADVAWPKLPLRKPVE